MKTPISKSLIDGDVNLALDALRADLMPLNRIKFGKACFSPHVPRDIQRVWVDYGGTVHTLKEATSEEHIRFFCYGRTDPWYGCLSQNAMAIFHASWVDKVVEANFMLPIAPFVLNSACLASPKPLPMDVTPSKEILQSQLARHKDVHQDTGPVYSSPSNGRERFLEETVSQAGHCTTPYKEKAPISHPFSAPRTTQTVDKTPPRQITSTPRLPPSIPSLPTKRTYESHFDPPRSIKKARISVMPEPQENPDVFPPPSKSSVSFSASTTIHTGEREGLSEAGKTISPDTSGDTLVAAQTIPHIDFRKIAREERRSSSRSRRITRSQRALQEKKQTEAPSLPFKSANKNHDVPSITMSAARTALRDVKVMKAAVILPRRLHLGKAFELSTTEQKKSKTGKKGVKSRAR